MRDLPYFKFWCMKVLPLVYDDSLSYYEVLCKVVKYINDLIASDKEIVGEIDKLKADMVTVQEWIETFNYTPLLKTVEEMVNKYISRGVFFEITDDGYFKVLIPSSWNEITFGTTGLDTFPTDVEFGHLTLSY